MDPSDENVFSLKFIFPNRDGLNVVINVLNSTPVVEVKEKLLSEWPTELPPVLTADRLRMICMGKGMLTPDTKTLKDFEIPKFDTHPTPVNVCIRPEGFVEINDKKKKTFSPKANGHQATQEEESSDSTVVLSRCECTIS